MLTHTADSLDKLTQTNVHQHRATNTLHTTPINLPELRHQQWPRSQTRHWEVNRKRLDLFPQLLNVAPVSIGLEMPVESTQLAILRCAVLQVNSNLDTPAHEA